MCLNCLCLNIYTHFFCYFCWCSFGPVSADNNELHPVKLRLQSGSNFVELVRWQMMKERECENVRATAIKSDKDRKKKV